MTNKDIFLSQFSSEEEYKNSGLVYDLNVSLIGDVNNLSPEDYTNAELTEGSKMIYHDSRFYDGGTLRIWIDDFPSRIDWNETVTLGDWDELIEKGFDDFPWPTLKEQIYDKFNFPQNWNFPLEFIQQGSEEDEEWEETKPHQTFDPYIYTGRQVVISGTTYYIWTFDTDIYNYVLKLESNESAIENVSPETLDNFIKVNNEYVGEISTYSVTGQLKYLLTTSIDYEDLKAQSLCEIYKNEPIDEKPQIQLGSERTKFKAFFAVMTEDNEFYVAKENAIGGNTDFDDMYLIRVDKLVDYYLYVDNEDAYEESSPYNIYESVANAGALQSYVFKPTDMTISFDVLQKFNQSVQNEVRMPDEYERAYLDTFSGTTELYLWERVPTRTKPFYPEARNDAKYLVTSINPKDPDLYDKLWKQSLQHNIHAVFSSFVAIIEEDKESLYLVNVTEKVRRQSKKDAEADENHLTRAYDNHYLFKIKKVYK